jgi:hypothetical protein
MEAAMKRALTYPHIAAGLAAGILIGLFASGAAHAITDTVFRYSAVQTGYYNINVAGLVPQVAGADYAVNGGTSYIQSSTVSCYATDVHLPDRARMTGVTVWYNGTGAGIVTNLVRINVNTGLNEFLFSKINNDSGGNRVARLYPVSGTEAAINNKAFSYAVEICLSDSAAKFYGARIAYTYNSAGD